jgi:hypothetical protein
MCVSFSEMGEVLSRSYSLHPIAMFSPLYMIHIIMRKFRSTKQNTQINALSTHV